VKRRPLEFALVLVLIAVGAALLQRAQHSRWHRGDWHLGWPAIPESQPGFCGSWTPSGRVCPETVGYLAANGKPARVNTRYGTVAFDTDYLDGPRGHFEVGMPGTTLFHRMPRETLQVNDTFFWETPTEVIRATVIRNRVQQLTLIMPFTCPDQKQHNCDFKAGWWRNQY
jgi:hypothetical protein